MATKIVKIQGKAYWARVFEENRDTLGWDGELADTGGQYTVNVELDADALHALTVAKSQVPNYPKTMTDENGDEITVYRVKRFHEKYDRKGNLLEFASGAPKVYQADGKTPWSVEDDGFLGNGSVIECTLAVYEAGKVVGTRLESIKVIDYVEPPVKEVA